MNRRSFLLATAATAFAAPVVQATEDGFILHGGAIHLDAFDPVVEAIVVRDGRTVFSGALAEARREARGLKEIDLKGGAAYPGFVDAHVHLTGVGLRAMTLNLDQVKSIGELVAAVKAWNAAHPGTDPLTGRGWIETHWPEKRFPTRADLDAVSATRPVVLERADGHAVVLNSAALRLAGIDKATKDPAGGRIERGADGEATGMLIDGAMPLIERRLPALSYERRKEALARATTLYAARGWTRAGNMSTAVDDVRALRELAAEGRLPIRVDAYMTPEDAGEVLERGPYEDPTGLVRVRGVKLYMDGALGSRGAALLKPYSDRPDTSGLLVAEHDATLAIMKRALAVNAQVAIHAIGDRGNRLALDWIDEAFASASNSVIAAVSSAPWRIEHAQVIDPADIPRLRELGRKYGLDSPGIVASMQPSHAIGDLYFAPSRLGSDRLAGAYAWRTLADIPTMIAFGSDAPVEVGDPRIEFYAAVARKDLQGRSGPGWHPEQALRRDLALAIFTAGGTAAAGQYGGWLSEGLPADITVFSTDILTASEADIITAKPLLTIVAGKIVHDGR